MVSSASSVAFSGASSPAFPYARAFERRALARALDAGLHAMAGPVAASTKRSPRAVRSSYAPKREGGTLCGGARQNACGGAPSYGAGTMACTAARASAVAGGSERAWAGASGRAWAGGWAWAWARAWARAWATACPGAERSEELANEVGSGSCGRGVGVARPARSVRGSREGRRCAPAAPASAAAPGRCRVPPRPATPAGCAPRAAASRTRRREKGGHAAPARSARAPAARAEPRRPPEPPGPAAQDQAEHQVRSPGEHARSLDPHRLQRVPGGVGREAAEPAQGQADAPRRPQARYPRVRRAPRYRGPPKRRHRRPHQGPGSGRLLHRVLALERDGQRDPPAEQG